MLNKLITGQRCAVGDVTKLNKSDIPQALLSAEAHSTNKIISSLYPLPHDEDLGDDRVGLVKLWLCSAEDQIDAAGGTPAREVTAIPYRLAA